LELLEQFRRFKKQINHLRSFSIVIRIAIGAALGRMTLISMILR